MWTPIHTHIHTYVRTSCMDIGYSYPLFVCYQEPNIYHLYNNNICTRPTYPRSLYQRLLEITEQLDSGKFLQFRVVTYITLCTWFIVYALNLYQWLILKQPDSGKMLWFRVVNMYYCCCHCIQLAVSYLSRLGDSNDFRINVCSSSAAVYMAPLNAPSVRYVGNVRT